MVRVGLRVPQHLDADYAIDFAILAEKLGYHSLWVNDHLVAPHREPTVNQLESWTLLSALSALTSKIRLGTLVLCNPLRHPSLTAKMAATLDILSKGRIELGLGAGWKKSDFEMVGFDGSVASENACRLEEALQIILKLWAEDDVSFNGKYYRVKGGYCVPKPLQKPHPPVLLGGASAKSIKLISKYADKYNMLMLDAETYNRKHKTILLERQRSGNPDQIIPVFSCNVIIKINSAEFGRQLDEVSRRFSLSVEELLTESFVISGSAEECASKLQEYRKFIDEFVISFPDTGVEDQLEEFMKEVVPKVEQPSP